MGYNRFGPSTGKSYAKFLDLVPRMDNCDLNDFPKETTMEVLTWPKSFSHQHALSSQESRQPAVSSAQDQQGPSSRSCWLAKASLLSCSNRTWTLTAIF